MLQYGPFCTDSNFVRSIVNQLIWFPCKPRCLFQFKFISCMKNDSIKKQFHNSYRVFSPTLTSRN